MGPAFYIMAIMGCGEADAACDQVAVVESRYESLEACNRETDGAVLKHQDAAYPVIVAQCQRADSPIAGNLKPHQIDLPEAKRKLDVRRAAYTPRPLRG